MCPQCRFVKSTSWSRFPYGHRASMIWSLEREVRQSRKEIKIYLPRRNSCGEKKGLLWGDVPTLVQFHRQLFLLSELSRSSKERTLNPPPPNLETISKQYLSSFIHSLTRARAFAGHRQAECSHGQSNGMQRWPVKEQRVWHFATWYMAVHCTKLTKMETIEAEVEASSGHNCTIFYKSNFILLAQPQPHSICLLLFNCSFGFFQLVFEGPVFFSNRHNNNSN
jgi:hypothetical protein